MDRMRQCKAYRSISGPLSLLLLLLLPLALGRSCCERNTAASFALFLSCLYPPIVHLDSLRSPFCLRFALDVPSSPSLHCIYE